MPTEVIMPKVDMDMTHGSVATWHVAEGDEVRQGTPLFDIETDKAAMEVEAPASGHLHGISAKPGEPIPVGTVVAFIYAEGEAYTEAPAPSPTPPAAPASMPAEAASPDRDMGATGATADASPSPISSVGAEIDRPTPLATLDGAPDPAALRATPSARAAARRAGLSLADVAGTGPRGRIQRDDVLARIDDGEARADAPSPPASWTAEAGPLSVTRRPGTGTPLVLIHGFTADSQSWAALEKALGAGRPLIRIDLPGHGRSPRLPVRGFTDLARLVLDAFDAATRDAGPVHLVGHSLGAALALSIADVRARRLASLAMVAPAGLGPEVDAAALAGIARASRTESLAPWLRRLTATPEGISDDYARAAMRLRADPALRAYQTDLADRLFPDGVQAFDLRPALARLDVPAAVIWGRRDHILPHRHAFAADGEIAIHLLKGAGHVPQIECPDLVARILRRLMIAADGSG